VALALAGCGGGDTAAEASSTDVIQTQGNAPVAASGASAAATTAGAPAAPTSLLAVVDADGGVDLSWSASVGAGVGAGVTYVLSRCDGVGCTPDTELAVTTATQFSDRDLPAGTAHVYQVVARGTDGRVSAPTLAKAVTPAAAVGATLLAAGDAVVPGVLTTPFPTLQNATIEWTYSGDNNANGWVSLRYRARGETTWQVGMPLRRILAGSSSGFSWATRHSGSLFDLKPGTTYDVELSLLDPDGGSVMRSTTITTRSVPAAAVNATFKNATPSTLAAILASANAGDVVQLAAGSYAAFSLERDGAAGRPLVIRGTPGAVISGEINVLNRHDVMLDSVTVNGHIRFNGTNNMTVVRSTVNANASVRNGNGITSELRSQNAYIADNVVTGTTTWADSSLGVSGNNRGEGIEVTGPGHVIMNNRVSGFRDAISLMEDDEAVDQHSIDILNNDISAAADDGVEADFCFHNCRIMRNRLTNVFIGLSSQPSLGGPTYFIRNVMFNVAHVAFKLYRGSYGDVILHNTVVKGGDGFAVNTDTPVGRLYTRNNLFIGGPGGSFGGYSSGSGRPVWLPSLQTANALMDYDAYGSTLGTFTGRYGSTSFSSLAQLKGLNTEKQATQVDLSVFAATISLPTAAMTNFAKPDLRLRAGGSGVDKGVAISNVNTGYAGSAPDVGAYEVGAALPVYGPR
jgi:hypothetical protein